MEVIKISDELNEEEQAMVDEILNGAIEQLHRKERRIDETEEDKLLNDAIELLYEKRILNKEI